MARMEHRVLAGLVCALAVELSAQSIALSGKVADANGKAIGGAIVSLKSKQLSDTTDAAGAYALNGVATSLNREEHFPGKGSAALVNGMVRVELTGPQRVRVDLLDLRGNL